jgi:hypothetical protein
MLNDNVDRIEHTDRLGNNAIGLAAGYGHIKIVKWFL